MPFFELGGKIFETEYGPINEMHILDALDDMTAMYVITGGNFDGLYDGAVDKITQIAHDRFESVLNMSLGIGLGLSSVVPGPAGIPVRKVISGFATGAKWFAGSSTLDAAMRRQAKHELKKKYARIQMKEQRRIEEGRK